MQNLGPLLDLQIQNLQDWDLESEFNDRLILTTPPSLGLTDRGSTMDNIWIIDRRQ